MPAEALNGSQLNGTSKNWEFTASHPLQQHVELQQLFVAELLASG